MTYIDSGIEEYQKFTRGVSAQNADYVYFGNTDITTVTGSETLSDITEYIRVAVDWSQAGANSLFVADLGTGDAIGSLLKTYGLVTGADVGSGVLHSINLATLGSKTNLFSISLQGEIVIERG